MTGKQSIRRYLDDFIDYSHYRVNAPRIIATIDVPYLRGDFNDNCKIRS